MTVKYVQKNDGKTQTFGEMVEALNDETGVSGAYAGSFAGYDTENPNFHTPNFGLVRQKWAIDKKVVNSHSPDESKIISVRGNVKTKLDPDGQPAALLILFERNTAHIETDGEIFIVSDGSIHRAALTEKVAEKLREGELIEVETE